MNHQNHDNHAVQNELEDLASQINETKMNIQSLVSLLGSIANEDLLGDFDLSDYADFKSVPDVFPTESSQFEKPPYKNYNSIPEDGDQFPTEITPIKGDKTPHFKKSINEPGKIIFRPSVQLSCYSCSHGSS